MSRLSAELLSRPMNIASFVLAAATAAVNLCVAVLITVRLLRGMIRTWRMFALLVVLNMLSMGLQGIVGFCTYWTPDGMQSVCGAENVCVGLLFLGFAWMQLELRIVFGVLFASRPEDIWTPAAKTRARIAIVVAHFALAWAEYFSGFASLVSTLRTIRIVGLVIHAVLLSLTSTVQAYLVISALLKTSKKISPDDSTARRRRLIFTMCFGSTAQLMAILSFGYVALFLKPNNLESQILYWLNDQFSAACIGIEAVSQTLSLLIMVDLVAGKPVAMGVTLMKRISQVAQRRTLKQEAYNDDSDMVFSAQAPHNTIAIPASTGIQPDTSSNE